MPIQAEETPGQKFDRLSQARIYQIEEAIRKFANLSNPYIYEYDDEDKQAAFDRILKALEGAEQKFSDGLRRAERLRGKRDEDDGISQVRGFRKRR